MNVDLGYSSRVVSAGVKQIESNALVGVRAGLEYLTFLKIGAPRHEHDGPNFKLSVLVIVRNLLHYERLVVLVRCGGESGNDCTVF